MNPLFPIRKLLVYCASFARYRASLLPRPVTTVGLVVALLMAGMAIRGRAQVVDGRQLVKAQLVADTQHIEPGQNFRLGVLYTMVPKWHIYWKYAGDAGIPTQIDWQLPPGFQAGPLQWPLPSREQEPGGLEVFDYNNE